MKRPLSSVLLFIFLAAALPASSAVILLDLSGKAGSGLISGNQNTVINGTPGSGGEIGAGITYDNATNVLTINVAWGFANGFTNLTGNGVAGHIHGPTPSGGTASFTQDASVLFNLDDTPAWNPSASAGGITNRTIILTELQEADLLAGRYYINIHTGTNGGGEIRGNLVPEPSVACLGLAGALLAGYRRRSRP